MRTIVFVVLVALTTTQTGFSQAPTPMPGKEHELLKKHLGTRSGTMKLMPNEQTKQAIEFPIKETNTLIQNGFWVESKFDAGPYQGRGVMGYDPVKKKYVGTWTSNVSPFLSVMAGTYNEKTHEMTMLFTDTDPSTLKPVDMKSVGRDAPGEPETFKMYQKDANSGEWKQTFVITYNDDK